MRVIAGRLGGRRLVAAAGTSTRPTADRVREALFSRLESRYGLAGARVLDVFAGTGALAIEALSRGAAAALCIENERAALAALRRNASALALEDRLQVMAQDFATALRAQAEQGGRFDGVFVDPPYAKGLAERALALLDAGCLVAPGGWVVLEVARNETACARMGALVLRREDEYGDTKLLLYERDGDETGDARQDCDRPSRSREEPRRASRQKPEEGA